MTDDAVETHAFVYAGSRQFAGLVAQTLREEGLVPESWIAPGQPPGVSTAVEAESLAEMSWIAPEQHVTVVFLVGSSVAQLRGAIAKACERLRGRASIDWDDAAPSTGRRRDKKIAGPIAHWAGPADQQLSTV